MKPDQLYEDLRCYCLEHASEANVKKYSRYFKSGVYDAWGLNQADMDAKKDQLKKSGKITLDLIFETAPLLMKSGKYEETSFALTILGSLIDMTDQSTFKRLEQWFTIGISNWAHADYLGMFLLPAYLKKGIVKQEDFIGWISSPYKFQRRCVPVTFIKLLKTGVEFHGLFTFVEPLMRDSEREVHQGMGWFLREAWKIKPEETEAFLLKWKDIAPRLIFQYACEKMKPEEKLKFRKAK
jgi:3-methyladenine DNA glycosylase AlkD